MKKKLLIFIPIIFVICIIAFVLLSDISYDKKLTIKIGDKIPEVKDYFKKNFFVDYDNIKITWNELNESVAGVYEGFVKIKSKEYKVSLEIIDNEKPVIECNDEIVVLQYSNFNYSDYIIITDNSSDELDINVSNDYDLTKIGSYDISISVKDKSDNKTVKNVSLKVISEAEKNGKNIEELGVTSKGFKIQKIDGITYVNGLLIANKTYSLPSNYNPGGLLSEMTSNFNNLKSDASKSGLNIYIISGYRSYNTQYSLYNNYVSRDGIAAADTYSARAGHSEHQTGLAADVNSLNTNFVYTKEGSWLKDNCYKYGFIIRYVENKDDQTGYMYEPWHIRYVGVDLATKLYNNGDWLTVEEYFGITSQYN